MLGRNRATYPLLASIFIVSSVAPIAHADIALQLNVDRQVSNAERAALERFKAALERQHVVTRPDQIVERVGLYLPLPGRPDRDVTRTTLIQRIDNAVNRAAHEAYDEAVAILEAVFRDLDTNPALIAFRSGLTQVGHQGTRGAHLLVCSQQEAQAGERGHDRSHP